MLLFPPKCWRPAGLAKGAVGSVRTEGPSPREVCSLPRKQLALGLFCCLVQGIRRLFVVEGQNLHA